MCIVMCVRSTTYTHGNVEKKKKKKKFYFTQADWLAAPFVCPT
jgi:hypothetical protein